MCVRLCDVRLWLHSLIFFLLERTDPHCQHWHCHHPLGFLPSMKMGSTLFFCQRRVETKSFTRQSFISALANLPASRQSCSPCLISSLLGVFKGLATSKFISRLAMRSWLGRNYSMSHWCPGWRLPAGTRSSQRFTRPQQGRLLSNLQVIAL